MFKRVIVGWKVSNRMDTQLVLDALNQALDARGRPSGVIHRSDKGSQYLSIKYGERLKQSGLAASVGTTGDSTSGIALRLALGRSTALPECKTESYARSGCGKYLLLFINSVRLCRLTQANLSPINSGWFIVSNHSTENTMLKESLPSFVLQWTTIVCLVVLLPGHIVAYNLLTLLIPSLIPMLQSLMGL